jgi:hypothetical protein
MMPPIHGIATKASIPVTVCITHIIAMRSPVCFKKRFHHLAENLAIALIQGADFRLICRSQCHSGMNVVRGWEGVNDALDVGLDVSPVGR